MPILADKIQELMEALHSKETHAIIDEAGDVLYVASYGLRFSTEVQGELASIGRSTLWTPSQMPYFSPNSEIATSFIDNTMRLQRPISGGAELTEVWFEAQSLNH